MDRYNPLLPPTKPLTVCVLDRDGERYVFMYEDGREQEMRQALGRYASDPELSFSWGDAARVSKEMEDHK